MHLYLGGSY